ncbi:MAG: hypothetical protein RIQ41_436, partial [Candidatus Parcubacteria bacterium]
YGYEPGYYGFCDLRSVSLPSVLAWEEDHPHTAICCDDEFIEDRDWQFLRPVGVSMRDPRPDSVVPGITFRGQPVYLEAFFPDHM